MKVLWRYHEAFLVLLWKTSGLAQETLWDSYKEPLDLRLTSSILTLNVICTFHGVPLDLFWRFSGFSEEEQN